MGLNIGAPRVAEFERQVARDRRTRDVLILVTLVLIIVVLGLIVAAFVLLQHGISFC
jgi:hypothetical protein